MAKAKIAAVSQKIADGVVGGYQKIENGVVNGYRKIEEGAVTGFGRITDWFVERYLTKEGETVEQAKARLKSDKDAPSAR